MTYGTWRETRQIGRKAAANIHHATRFAAMIGRPLNQSVVINFARTDCPPRLVSVRFRQLLARGFARWLRQARPRGRPCPPTHVWVIEAARGQTHVHWAVHIPRGLVGAFRAELAGWVAAAGAVEVAGVELGAVEPGAVAHRPIRNIVGLKRYMLKGMDPHFAAAWKIRAVPQGLVFGRRTGYSRSLGPAARKAAGYRPQRPTAGRAP